MTIELESVPTVRSPKPSKATRRAGVTDTSRPRERAIWLDAYRSVRNETERRAAPLSPEDQVIQSMPDASPTKWHRAHTTWFFEQFLLVPHLAGLSPVRRALPFLFNSYYVAAGPRHARPQRGLITRPDAAEVAAYRQHVDAAVAQLIETARDDALDGILGVLEIGLHHEQQHQELILTDILHAFAQNPTAPAYDADWRWPRSQGRSDDFVGIDRGVYPIGHAGSGFSFDNEGPAHEVLLQPVGVARSLVTNAANGSRSWRTAAIETPALWLSDGWACAPGGGLERPWLLAGARRRVVFPHARRASAGGRAAPVCHVSYYEADAFARWAGKHLPSEAEWEVAARTGSLHDAFGVVWQWTRSAYAPYPGYRAAEGALGEYNGKFMVNQMVLRGSSLATPDGHARVTYRNFFYPPHRWQFMRPAARGLRRIGAAWLLSRDLPGYPSHMKRRRRSRPTCLPGSGANRRRCRRSISTTRRARPVRAHHRAAGVLSDAHRARDSQEACAGDRPAAAGARRPDRIRQRVAPQGVAAAASPAPARRLCAGGDFAPNSCTRRRRSLRREFPGSRWRRSRPISPSRSQLPVECRGAAACRLLSRLDHRQLRAARGLDASCAMPDAFSAHGAAFVVGVDLVKDRAVLKPPTTMRPASPRRSISIS